MVTVLCLTYLTLISDHSWILCSLLIARPKSVPKVIKFRQIKAIEIEAFKSDIQKSSIGQPSAQSLDSLVSDYSSVLTALLDKHAPEKEKKVLVRSTAPWYTSEVKSAKRQCRAAERKWRSTGLTVHKEIFGQAQDNVASHIEAAKRSHDSDRMKSCGPIFLCY